MSKKKYIIYETIVAVKYITYVSLYGIAMVITEIKGHYARINHFPLLTHTYHVHCTAVKD